MTPRKRFRAGIPWVAAVVPAALWLASFPFYTTAGFDFEERWGPQVLTHYHRVRWDAGVFWIGQADQPHGTQKTHLDWFDPGGTLFARSIPPAPRTLANRLGFWFITQVADDPYEPIRYRGAIMSRWVGVPGWLTVAPAVVWVIGDRRRSRSDRRVTS